MYGQLTGAPLVWMFEWEGEAVVDGSDGNTRMANEIPFVVLNENKHTCHNKNKLPTELNIIIIN